MANRNAAVAGNCQCAIPQGIKGLGWGPLPSCLLVALSLVLFLHLVYKALNPEACPSPKPEAFLEA